MLRKWMFIITTVLIVASNVLCQTGNATRGTSRRIKSPTVLQRARGTSQLRILARGAQTNALTTFQTSLFTGSGNCAPCHSNLVDSTGADVSMDAQWRSTLMANSAKDPLWQAKISSEITRQPALKSTIEKKCARCHMGMASVQAEKDVIPIAVFDDILNTGFINPTHDLHEAAMDGVSCSLCHQIRADNLGSEDSYTGHYIIDKDTSSPGRLIYGSFANIFANMMRMQIGYTPVQGLHLKISENCATCHMLYTPTVDENGQVVGEFPEQTPYLEWLESSYNAPGQPEHAECQTCHMPAAPGLVQISNRPIWLARREFVGRHEFVGGNTLLLDILKTHTDELGVTADAVHIDATKSLALDLLQAETGAIEITGASLTPGSLSVNLAIANVSGHKFPTGVPLRRVWIHLTAKNRNNKTVFESGKPGTDGSIVGNNADTDPADYEPHHSLIETEDQVQIYEPIMLDTQGNVTYTFLRAAAYAKDNRLLPAGFEKVGADDDIAVWGNAYSDTDFIGGSDAITYKFAVNEHQGPFTVTAELLYQPVSYRAIQDLSQDDNEQVNRFVGYYNSADKTPVQIAMTQIQTP